jgi:uncharacterized protein (TIGR03437 family)
MFHRVSMLCAFGVVVSAAFLQAQPNLFVLPGAGSASTTAQAFTATPVTATNQVPVTNFRTFTPGAGAFALIPNLNASSLFIVTSSPVNSLESTDETVLNVTSLANLSPAPTQAVITPDGQVLAVAAGTVNLYNATSGSPLISGLSQAAGLNTVSVAASLDSTSIFALASNAASSQLNSISTSTHTISGSLPLNAPATAVTVGPNGLVYVSLQDEVLEVDPRTLLPTFNGAMPVNGTPGPLVFTPDGGYGLAINESGTGGSIILVSLGAHSATVPSLGITQVTSLQPIGIDTMLALTSGGLLYQLTISTPGLSGPVVSAAGPISIAGVGSRGVIAMTASNDVPSAGHTTVQGVFLVSQKSIYQYLPSSQTALTPTAISSNVSPGAVFYEVPAVTTTQAAPTSLLTYGANQTILPGTTSEPLVVQVLDANNVPVSGVNVQFQIGGSGTLSSTSGTTGSNGYAVTYVTASQVNGVVTVVANVPNSGVTPAAYSITVTPAAQGSGGPTLSIISGQGQLMEESTNTQLGPGFGAPLEVLATDVNNNPIADLPVTFKVPSGSGTLFFNNVGSPTQIVNTNASGVARVDFLTTGFPSTAVAQGFFQTSITATAPDAKPVTFYNTTYPSGFPPAAPTLGTAPGTPFPLTGGEGTVVPAALRVQVISVAGSKVPNVSLYLVDANANPTVYPTASCNAPNGIVLSDSNGVASCDILFGPTIGASSFTWVVGYTRDSTSSESFTVTPGPPTVAQIVQGNNQTGLPGQTLPLALRIHVTDSAGNVVQGAAVTWSVVTPGTVTLSNQVNATDSIGDASALATLGSTGGTAQVTATVGSVTATFNLTVNVLTAGLQKVSGDQQTATISAAFGSPLVVKAVDSSGNPVAGAQVSFQVTAGTATLGSSSAVTTANGQATTTVTAGATAGAITVTATSATFSVSFTLTALLPGPQNITIVNGASFDPNTGISPGSIATIRGVGILPGVSGVLAAPLTNGQYPTTFSGVTVTFDGTPAPIYYVEDTNGADQVTVQVPFEVQPGSAVALQVSVANEGSPATVMVPVKPLAPGVFTSVYGGKTYAVAVRPDGSQVSPTNPAQRGETIQLYITGLGQATPTIATNAPGVADQAITSTLIVGLNNGGVRLVSAVYGPGLVGIYIVIMEVPENTKTGPYQPIGIVAYDSEKNAYFSQPTYIPIQ